VIVGMVGTRFAGLDGVSLEADKLATILQEDGHQVVWFASELGDRFRPGTTHPPAHFTHPANRALQPELFGTHPPTPATIRTLRERTGELRVALGWFLREYEVEVAIVQNALACRSTSRWAWRWPRSWSKPACRYRPPPRLRLGTRAVPPPQLPRLLHSVFPPPCRGCGTW
jgi:hypothetical protein